jgi:DNA-binding NtrC family response regulator
MCPARILIVDVERHARTLLRQELEARGHEVQEAATGVETLTRLQRGVELVMLDPLVPDFTGLELLRRCRQVSPETPVVVMTATPSVEGAVEAMRLGAVHYTVKPLAGVPLAASLDAWLEPAPARTAVRSAVSANDLHDVDHIVGQSPQMQEFKTLLRKIATLQSGTVLITGETGTGKDMAARALHATSPRKNGPFMHITCSALPEALLESELFGHERGAFTDAKAQKKGLFELARGGTVFLDEIGEMSLVLQAKLLRFLEEKTFKRVGGSVDIHVDVAVVAATNRDLRADVHAFRFREDLYYRLNVMPLEVPPLRERLGDVPLLVRFYIARFNTEFSRNISGLSREAMAGLEANHWTGNVRELRNQLQRAMLLTENTILQAADFPRPVAAPGTAAILTLPARGVDFEELERDLVVQALALASGNQTRAGALLRMNRDQIRYRMDKFGLRAPRLGVPAEAAVAAPAAGAEEFRHNGVGYLHSVPASAARG